MNSGPDHPQEAADDRFWLEASQPSLNLIWDNPEDDVYSKLLENEIQGIRRNSESDLNS